MVIVIYLFFFLNSINIDIILIIDLCRYARYKWLKKMDFPQKNNFSPAGNRTPVSRVTGGDTNHYTTEEFVRAKISELYKNCIIEIDIFINERKKIDTIIRHNQLFILFSIRYYGNSVIILILFYVKYNYVRYIRRIDSKVQNKRKNID